MARPGRQGADGPQGRRGHRPGQRRRARRRRRPRRCSARDRGGRVRRGHPDPRRLAAADAPDPAPGDQPEAARAGDPRPPAAGTDRTRGRRGGRRDDPQERVQAEDADAPRGGGAGAADLRPQGEHDPPDAVEPDLDLLARDRPSRGGDARDRGGDRDGPEQLRTGRALAAERLHPAAPAPDGGAGEPRLPVTRPRAVPPGQVVPGRGTERLAMIAAMAVMG